MSKLSTVFLDGLRLLAALSNCLQHFNAIGLLIFTSCKHYISKSQSYTKKDHQRSVPPSSSLLTHSHSSFLSCLLLTIPCRGQTFGFWFILFIFLLHKGADMPVFSYILFLTRSIAYYSYSFALWYSHSKSIHRDLPHFFSVLKQLHRTPLWGYTIVHSTPLLGMGI